MKQNNLKDLYKYAQQNQTKVKRGILYSILNKLFDLAPPVLIGVAIDIVVEGSDSFIGSFGFEDRRQQLIILAFITFVIWGLESIFDLSQQLLGEILHKIYNIPYVLKLLKKHWI